MSARLASMSGILKTSPDSVYGLPDMTTQKRLPRMSWVRVWPFHTPSMRRVPSDSEMNFCRNSGCVCCMSSMYSITLLAISSARLSFSSSLAAVASGAWAGSSERTEWPSAGPLIFMKIRPRRLATYSISVVLP